VFLRKQSPPSGNDEAQLGTDRVLQLAERYINLPDFINAPAGMQLGGYESVVLSTSTLQNDTSANSAVAATDAAKKSSALNSQSVLAS
jgi:hypothetical protein